MSRCPGCLLKKNYDKIINYVFVIISFLCYLIVIEKSNLLREDTSWKF